MKTAVKKQQAGFLKIGDAARMLNTTQRTLRFYEEEGLLQASKTTKGTRFYSIDDLERLKVVLLLTTLDMPIKVVKQLAFARSESSCGDEASRKVSRLLRELRNKAEQNKNQYIKLVHELVYADELARQCFGCAHRPTRENCLACQSVKPLGDALLFNLILEQEEKQLI